MDVKPAIEYIPAQGRDKLGTDLSDLLIIVFVRSQSIFPRLWYQRTEPLCSFLELSVVLNGHYARNDGNIDADSSDILDPLLEGIKVVEHLSENECSARIDLGLHVLHFNIFTLSIWMTFREASDCNIEMITILLSDEPD